MPERTGYLLKDDDLVSTVVETSDGVEKFIDVELDDPQQKAVAKRDVPIIRRYQDGLYKIKLESYKNTFGSGWTINTFSKIDAVEELNRIEKNKKLFEALQEMVGLGNIEEVEEEEEEEDDD